MHLTRRKALTGTDSGMWRGTTIAYAREGADVVINYLPAEEEDAQEGLALIEQDANSYVGLDIVVKNTARQQTKLSILDISAKNFDTTIKT